MRKLFEKIKIYRAYLKIQHVKNFETFCSGQTKLYVCKYDYLVAKQYFIYKNT